MSVGLLVSLWGPVAVWAGLIFALSGIPFLKTPLGVWDLILRKMWHAVQFGVLAALVLRALRRRSHSTHRHLAFFSGVLCFLYAVSDEFHQSFVPGRTASALDVAFDMAGVIGVCVLWLRRHRAAAQGGLAARDIGMASG